MKLPIFGFSDIHPHNSEDRGFSRSRRTKTLDLGSLKNACPLAPVATCGTAFLISVAALIWSLSGCVMPVAGRDFVRPDSRVFSTENVAESDVLRSYGEPFSRGQFLKHNKQIHTLHYYYASKDFGGGVIYKKFCWFYFAGDVYLGYSFLTGFRDGQVNFDETKISQVVKGRTTKGEVLTLFGTPSGSLRYPATAEETTEEGDTVLDYECHFSSADNSSFENKVLRVVFDANGIVKDLDFDVNKKDQAPSERPRPLGGM